MPWKVSGMMAEWIPPRQGCLFFIMRKSFTLVELLVAIAILAVIAVLVISTVFRVMHINSDISESEQLDVVHCCEDFPELKMLVDELTEDGSFNANDYKIFMQKYRTIELRRKLKGD